MMDYRKYSEENRICLLRSGSHAYGLNTETSDVDTRGVFIGPPKAIIGLSPVEQIEGPGDRVIYELAKFIKLARDNNPNVIEFLYLNKEDVLESTHTWDRILENKHLFLSKKIRWTTAGYAHSQLGRVKGHRRWICSSATGISKLKDLYVNKNISLEWLNKHFDKDIVEKVIIT